MLLLAAVHHMYASGHHESENGFHPCIYKHIYIYMYIDIRMPHVRAARVLCIIHGYYKNIWDGARITAAALEFMSHARARGGRVGFRDLPRKRRGAVVSDFEICHARGAARSCRISRSATQEARLYTLVDRDTAPPPGTRKRHAVARVPTSRRTDCTRRHRTRAISSAMDLRRTRVQKCVRACRHARERARGADKTRAWWLGEGGHFY